MTLQPRYNHVTTTLQPRYNHVTTTSLIFLILSVFLFLVAGCNGRTGTAQKGHPTVIITVPADADTGISTNTTITATFGREMDPSTINTTTFTLMQGETPVLGTVTFSCATAVFTPASDLAPLTTYTAMLSTSVEDWCGNAMENSYVWSFTTGDESDTTVPEVTFTVPAEADTDVPSNTILTATFSEPMNPLTISATSFTLMQGETAILGAVTYTGVSAVFTPTEQLTANTVYTATITTEAEDLSGNALANDYVWSFTTGEVVDDIAPTVTHTAIANNSTNVSINTILTATFSEPMNPLTISTTSFTLMQGETAILGAVTYTGVSAVFTPTEQLAADTVYTATITTLASDLTGNPMEEDYVWSFTTNGSPDSSAPTVTNTSPLYNATGISINTIITATFSEPMDPLTINTTTFTLKRGTTTVLGTVTYSGVTAIFRPIGALASGTTYTATVKAGVKDLAGNSMVGNYTWNFTTGEAADTTRPTVTNTAPANNATGVSINTTVSATFSDEMNPLSITTTSFTLKQGTTSVLGTVVYSGVTAVFTPNNSLVNGTIYTATIRSFVRDIAGNAMLRDYTWRFTTGAAPDTTRPTVTQTAPLSDAIDVSTNTTVTATFNEPMAPLTITTLTFTLEDDLGASVLGSVTYSGVTAVFTPTVSLDANTTYTARVKTGAKDLAGNALLVEYVWSFTTGAAVEAIRPTVTQVAPLNNAINVPINTTVTATFSEPMAPLTINTLTFTLEDSIGDSVLGTVGYSGVIAIFTPSSDLASNATYTARIKTGAKDLAGNALLVEYVWSFTTSALPGPAPADLGAAAPYGAIGGGAGITNQGLLTVINGDIGTTAASTLVTGFRDSVGDIYTITPLNDGMVNGRIYTAPPPPGGAIVGGTAETEAIATAALLAAQTAYNNLSPALLPGGTSMPSDQLGGLTLNPGVYQSASGSFLITGADLTLDALGDANGVFVFQMGSSLTVGEGAVPRSVILAGNAQAKNVFWQVSSAATINPSGGGTMVGTIISYGSTTFSTPDNMIIVTLNGRALALNASVTMVNTIINVPAP